MQLPGVDGTGVTAGGTTGAGTTPGGSHPPPAQTQSAPGRGLVQTDTTGGVEGVWGTVGTTGGVIGADVVGGVMPGGSQPPL